MICGDEPLPARLLLDLDEAFDDSDLPMRVDVVDWAGARVLQLEAEAL